MSSRRKKEIQKIALITGSALVFVAVLGFAIFGIVKLVEGREEASDEAALETADTDGESAHVISIKESDETSADGSKDGNSDNKYGDSEYGNGGYGNGEYGDDEYADDPQFAGMGASSDEKGASGKTMSDATLAGDLASKDATAENQDISGVKSILNAGSAAETGEVTYGVDVAKYQGTIDWAKVAASGVQFAMVRVGYRTQSEGKITADTNAKYNMQEASANGIKLGAYFFSTAVSEAEAVEEADWVADYISQYKITYPVAYNCEGFTSSDSRQYSLTQSQRTEIARAFLNEIYNRGYTPMFYAAKNELTGNAAWDTTSLDNTYKMWIAYYPGSNYDYSMGPGYSGAYNMWQYSSAGKIDGISKNVDVNIAYFGYASDSNAKSDVAPETVSADVEALMNFREVNETVTAKNKTNLRDIPSQGEDSTVLVTLENPNTAQRTGISDSGWSRVIYGDKVCYAVSSYLTTDLNAPAQASQAASATPASQDDSGDNGIKTKFTACDDTITAKQEVNLRTLPSVTNEQAQVAYTLHNGETAHRTGYNQEYGWSRVEYNGQVLYCITSYISVVQ